MLHVVNGDAALELLRRSTVTGTFLPWKDMLMEGPLPADGGEIDLDARAAFLRDRYGADARKYRSGMRAIFSALDKSARGKDEVVLWFEEDFFCQIHLVYLLTHLPRPLLRSGRVSIICPDQPLGTRLPEAFPKLFRGRLPLTRALLTLARRVWKAYAAGTPKAWAAFLEWARAGDRFAEWPRLRIGLRSHLGRLPSARGEPGALETALLRSAADGPVDFALFARRVWGDPMIKPLGLGDLQIARYALDLSEVPVALLEIEGRHPRSGQAPDPRDWKIRRTPAGDARLDSLDQADKGGDAASTPRTRSKGAARTSADSKAGKTIRKAAKKPVSKAAKSSVEKAAKKA